MIIVLVTVYIFCGEEKLSCFVNKYRRNGEKKCIDHKLSKNSFKIFNLRKSYYFRTRERMSIRSNEKISTSVLTSVRRTKHLVNYLKFTQPLRILWSHSFIHKHKTHIKWIHENKMEGTFVCVYVDDSLFIVRFHFMCSILMHSNRFCTC